MTAQVEQKDWSEIKQFKDPVYGYIPVSRAYAKNLIDTRLMQRIKGVAQTGLRPVFSSATHDRFSHSLGVYKFGMEMYESLRTKLYDYVKNKCYSKWNLDDKFLEKLQSNLKHWKTLLGIACLLHDIGHPIQSHGFEFLYDDPYLDVTYDQTNLVVIDDTGADSKERERVYDQFEKFNGGDWKTPEGNLRSALLKLFQDKENLYNEDYYAGPLPGNPHERMSAYYILIDEQMRKNIEKLICASRKNAGIGQEDYGEISRDICFIARMIIGWEFPAPKQLAFNEEIFFNSIKNCIIRILNGTIDADGIDYLIRNSYAAGYDTSKIDSARLCNAYTTYEKSYLMYPAFSKSALSILEGYMSARNFEPKWLYSHHKVVYADVLTKQLYKFITWYLTERTMLPQSVKIFLKHALTSALVYDDEDKQDFGKDLLVHSDKKERVGLSINVLSSHMEHWSYPFYTYLLAPCQGYNICSHYFNHSSDSDMDALIHWMLNELIQYSAKNMEETYEKYKDCLKKRVLDGLIGDPSVEISAKKLRVLLSEDCYAKLEQSNEAVRSILKEWIESGDSCTAEQKVKYLDKSGLDLSPLTTLLNNTKTDNPQKLLEYWLNQYEPLLSRSDFENFMHLLEEYQTRSYRSSFWKSLPEYRLFLKDCARELGISPDDVGRYMEILITQGMEGRGFSVYDGKAVKIIPDQYKEQFFYQPDNREEQIKKVEERVNRRNHSTDKVPQKTGTGIVAEYANRIFTNTGSYDFSRNSLVVKFYRMKSKRFRNLYLLFNENPVPLEDVFLYQENGGSFPYFYYTGGSCGNPNSDASNEFKKDFIKFCREYRETEIRSENIRVGKSHILRDAVYGDIEMTEDFYAVVCTREFQRLRRIRQLATADRAFPNATHTRLAHSLGTWHVMQLILKHFEFVYHSNPQLNFSEQDRNSALLAALLHDLGHGPYSHTVEAVFGLDHEEMTRNIILDHNTEVHQVIEKRFGYGTSKRVCELLSGAPTEPTNGIDRIYHSLISGQLDADRMDYLLRDNTVCGMAFGHIDIQQLIVSMRLMPDYNDKQGNMGYRLCFDDRYLPAIEQFVYARYQMYKNIYHDPYKQLYEQIFDRIFRQAFSLLDAVKVDKTFSLLKEIHEKHRVNTSDYMDLDDEAVNTLIKRWADGDVLNDGISDKELVSRAKIIELLSRAFLSQRPLFECLNLGSHRRQYDLLAERVGKLLGLDKITSFCQLEESCSAFIFIQGSDYAYKMNMTGEDDKKILCSVVWTMGPPPIMPICHCSGLRTVRQSRRSWKQITVTCFSAKSC